MDDFVSEEAIDYQEIFRRGGRNLGDEDYALFKCPHCGRIYLLEYEVDTAYLDAHDLTRRVSVFDATFDCVICARPIPDDRPWIGTHAAIEFKVTWDELRASDWNWIVKGSENA